jgi:hypothetical protein
VSRPVAALIENIGAEPIAVRKCATSLQYRVGIAAISSCLLCWRDPAVVARIIWNNVWIRDRCAKSPHFRGGACSITGVRRKATANKVFNRLNTRIVRIFLSCIDRELSARRIMQTPVDIGDLRSSWDQSCATGDITLLID